MEVLPGMNIKASVVCRVNHLNWTQQCEED